MDGYPVASLLKIDKPGEPWAVGPWKRQHERPFIAVSSLAA